MILDDNSMKREANDTTVKNDSTSMQSIQFTRGAALWVQNEPNSHRLLLQKFLNKKMAIDKGTEARKYPMNTFDQTQCKRIKYTKIAN